MKLNDSLRQLRKQQHWSQKEISEALGVSRSTYEHYESGRMTPSISSLLLLCEIYHVSLSTLMGRG